MHVHACVCVFMHAHVHVCVCVCVCVYVCVYMHICRPIFEADSPSWKSLLKSLSTLVMNVGLTPSRETDSRRLVRSEKQTRQVISKFTVNDLQKDPRGHGINTHSQTTRTQGQTQTTE